MAGGASWRACCWAAASPRRGPTLRRPAAGASQAPAPRLQPCSLVETDASGEAARKEMYVHEEMLEKFSQTCALTVGGFKVSADEPASTHV